MMWELIDHTLLWIIFYYLSSQSLSFKHSMIELLWFLQVRCFTNQVIINPLALTRQDDWLDSDVWEGPKRGWWNCFRRSWNHSHCWDIRYQLIFAWNNQMLDTLFIGFYFKWYNYWIWSIIMLWSLLKPVLNAKQSDKMKTPKSF